MPERNERRFTNYHLTGNWPEAGPTFCRFTVSPPVAWFKFTESFEELVLAFGSVG